MATWRSLARLGGICTAIGRKRTIPTPFVLSRRPSLPMGPRVAFVHQFPSPEIKTEKAARNFIVTLDDRSRRLIYQEMQNFENERLQLQNGDKATVTKAELWNVFLFNGIPFVGFGILDNLVMIVAGEYIDATLGAVLGISTMAAAGLGNLVSDVAGVGTAGYVEAWTAKIGVTVPVLSAEQASHRSTRIVTGLGRAIGISIGCLIGMFPLLFFDGREPKDGEDKAAARQGDKEPARQGDEKPATQGGATLTKPTT